MAWLSDEPGVPLCTPQTTKPPITDRLALPDPNLASKEASCMKSDDIVLNPAFRAWSSKQRAMALKALALLAMPLEWGKLLLLSMVTW